MYRTHLREVEGSVVMAVPPALMEQLNLSVGAAVDLAVEDQKLVVKPETNLVNTMDELLALCDPNAQPDEEDREWLDAPPVGRELL